MTDGLMLFCAFIVFNVCWTVYLCCREWRLAKWSMWLQLWNEDRAKEVKAEAEDGEEWKSDGEEWKS